MGLPPGGHCGPSAPGCTHVVAAQSQLEAPGGKSDARGLAGGPARKMWPFLARMPPSGKHSKPTVEKNIFPLVRTQSVCARERDRRARRSPG